MGSQDSAVCSRHQPAVVMQLRTMHSDAGRPAQVVALYVCPACGHEVRRPLRLELEPAG